MHTKPFDPKQHWEAIYAKKDPQELSWFQAMPKVSLDLLAEHRVPPAARIIDVGGGDSLLVDHLLERGYSEVTVLDISGTALARAQRRLGAAAATEQWIEGDSTCFEAAAPFDVWHDRAVFHFLTNDAAVERYLERLSPSRPTHGAGPSGPRNGWSPRGSSSIRRLSRAQPRPRRWRRRLNSAFVTNGKNCSSAAFLKPWRSNSGPRGRELRRCVQATRPCLR